MGLEHRRTILESIPAGGRFLEWGAGGSTIWFSEKLPAGAYMITVEHNSHWASMVSPRVEMNCTILVRSPGARPARAPGRATLEDPTGLDAYFKAHPGPFDAILVDGVARNECLQRAPEILAAGGLVFLHDAERDWYQKGLELYDQVGRLPSCPDVPGPELWWGRPKGNGTPS